MLGVIVASGCIGIASAHATRTGAHAANAHGPRVGQFLHDLRPGDLELRRINLPTVTRRDIAESLRVELREAEPLLRTSSPHR